MAAPKWEYRIFHDLTAPELNPLGLEGWDFVTVEFDDEGEILNAFAKRPLGGGGQQGGSGGGGGGGGRRRRRRPNKGGGGGQQGGGSGHHIGPMQ
ncbi:MAG: hypothetical protein KDA24_03590 [Deltaproteobacteria bacterium]|nr:hypothetical protein [Deltaproteobacteria bacterium]